MNNANREQEVRFAGGCSKSKIDYLLGKLAPVCESCTGKKVYICIEQCCMRQPAYICLECDQDHRLHRRNELRLLFLDHAHRKPCSLLLKESIGRLSEFLTAQRRRSEELIEKQTVLVSLYTKALEQLEKTLPGSDEEWLERAYRIVQENVHTGKVSRQTRREFEEAMAKIDLYGGGRMKDLEGLGWLRKGLQDYQNNPLGNVQNSSTPVHDRLASLQNSIPESTEQLALRTNIEQFICPQQPRSLSTLATVGINRSKYICDEHVTELQASRVIVESDWREYYDCALGDQVTELHTMISLQQLPSRLESLSYLAWSYNQPQRIRDMREFPATLRKLKIDQNDDRNKKVPYQLDHLKDLKYLTILDNALWNSQQKAILQLAIRNQFHMLCLLTTPRREGYENVLNRRAKIETTWTHQYECLERHYLVFKRKQLQICLLARNKYLRRSYWAEEVVNFADCELEREIQQQFDT